MRNLAKTIAADGDDPKDLAAFVKALWADLAPKGALQEALASEIVSLSWRLQRQSRIEAGLLNPPDENQTPAMVFSERATAIAQSTRICKTLNESLARTLGAYARLQKRAK